MKIGLSLAGRMPTDEVFLEYKESGIEYMEVSVTMNDYDNLDIEKIGELSKRYGIKLWSFHLPFQPFAKIDISSPELAEYTVEYFKSFIKRGADIGIDKFVIHPSGEPIPEDMRKIRMESAKKSLAALADYAEKLGVTIAVEDLPRTCLGRNFDEILELLSSHPALRCCFDTNHLLKEDNIDFIKKVGKKIVTLHVSDYDFVDEKHWLPGEGKIDWYKLYEALLEIGYDGAWMYELGFKNTKTITRERELNCSDFVKNANEIFEGKPITVIPHEKHL